LKITAFTLKIDELLRNKIIHFHKKKKTNFLLTPSKSVY